VPEHWALVTIVAVPPDAVHVPVHMPLHVPSQCTDGSVPGVHVPVQSASHEPVHWAETVAEPSHVALASHIPLHWPEISPG
jgi:hypothetical protein